VIKQNTRGKPGLHFIQSFRRTFELLFNCLTVLLALGIVACLNACHPFSNDLSHDIAPGTERAYDTKLPAGTLAHEILTSKNFPFLLVEIQAVKGYSPSQESLDQLRAFLEKHANRPSRVSIVVDPPINAPAHAADADGYSLSDIEQIEARNRRHYTTKGKLALYALFLDWNFSGDLPKDRILGRADRSQSVAIFMNSLRMAIPGTAAHPSYAETTTLLHEFGHLMGIVSMDETQRAHADLAHHSCTNAKCLMNHAAESSAQIAAFTADQVPVLDDDCENDLKALRN
jgi:hypothetical protein